MNADTEAKVKAAFIFNFTRFITWKSDKNDAPLRIVIFGSEKINAFLKAYVEEKNLSSQISVISVNTPPDGKENINLLFIDNSKERFSGEILRQLSGKNVLTVSDIEDFVLQGGIIGMYNEGGRIKLAINLSEANKSGLKISAKLLEVAKVIK
ncbi:MAG: YfiR family protein [Ignavibacteriaceae bacterium]|nr:YfiR family protein [Ignavibacteriaceae bacterium]